MSMVWGHRGVLLLPALGLASACYHGVESVSDIVSTREVGFNNQVLNGIHLNGIHLNGIHLNGIHLNGMHLNGIHLNGIHLNGTEFSAVFPVNGEEVPRSGLDFIGAEFEMIAEGEVDGVPAAETFLVRIDDITPDAQWGDTYLYELSYRPVLSDVWTDLCAGGVPAIPLNNYWDLETGDRIDDPNVATFACTNAVLAKCVEWGYRPWAEATRCKDWDSKKKKKGCTEVSLQDYHQACTRMARADYCGDGTPWTVPGTAIDIYDHLNPQIEAMATDWTIEAEWTPEGAYCLNDIRQQTWKQQGLYPKCFLDKKGKPKKYKDCGSMKNGRSLLLDAFKAP